jgi:hypothetical protein
MSPLLLDRLEAAGVAEAAGAAGVAIAAGVAEASKYWAAHPKIYPAVRKAVRAQMDEVFGATWEPVRAGINASVIDLLEAMVAVGEAK